MAAPDLILHYAPDNASLCVRLYLLSQNVPFTTCLVDRRVNGQRSKDYLRLNPNGLIPTLETPEGVVSETGAILLWLARATPIAGTAAKWLFWLSNTLHTAERMLFYPAQFVGDDAAAQAALRQKTSTRIGDLLTILTNATDAQWLADAGHPNSCYLAPLLRWPALYGGQTNWFDLQNWPRLHGFAQMMDESPHGQQAARAEGLGPLPFSAPQYPQPPEGSAT